MAASANWKSTFTVRFGTVQRLCSGARIPMRMALKCKFTRLYHSIPFYNLLSSFYSIFYYTFTFFIFSAGRPYFATQNRPNYARKIFPCFDEPAFKVPFTVSISRPSNYTTLFNTEVVSTENR